MSDCVADTNILADIIAQFDSLLPDSHISSTHFIDEKKVVVINKIIDRGGIGSLIIGSSFAFLEIANKFSVISDKKFDKKKLIAFIRQPPEWFGFENISLTTSLFLAQIPKFTKKGLPVELTDAIHVAIALQRGNNTILATTDSKLLDLADLPITII